MQFGRKSERLDRQIEQLELRLEELKADEGTTPVEIPDATLTVPEQAPRRPLLEHLPRDVQTHLPKSREKCRLAATRRSSWAKTLLNNSSTCRQASA